MIPILLALLQTVTAKPTSLSLGEKPSVEQPIVVTARSTTVTAKALADCFERRCSPAEDIAASIAHAENQFLDGDYAAASRTLAASRGRNLRFATTMPVQVAGLARAYGRLGALIGRPDQMLRGSFDAVNALKAGLPAQDERIAMQRLETADALIRQARLREAVGTYNAVAEAARRGGQTVVEGHALYRIATLYSGLATANSHYRAHATQAVARITRTTDPALAPFREAVALMQAQYATRLGDAAALDKAIAGLRGRPTMGPVLVYALPIELPRPPIAGRGIPLRGQAEAQWANISYWIMPDGSVRDVEVLRRSPRDEGSWTAQVRRSLTGRRYLPLSDAAKSGMLRVERYSLVYPVTPPEIGSRLPSRSPYGQIYTLDLTAAPNTAK